MKVAMALIVLTVLLGGSFLLGHRLGAPSRPSADKSAHAVQAPPQSSPVAAPRPVRIGTALAAAAGAGAVQRAREAAYLTPGAQTDLQAPHAARAGIVHADGGTPGDACGGVAAPVSTRLASAGACRAGWVSRQSVQLMAG